MLIAVLQVSSPSWSRRDDRTGATSVITFSSRDAMLGGDVENMDQAFHP